METTQKFYFARRCDVTGEGMNEGFCIGEGEMYIKHESDLIAHLRTLDWEFADGKRPKDIESDDELRELLYDVEYFYHTYWEDDEMEYVSDHADGRDATTSPMREFEVTIRVMAIKKVNVMARSEFEAKCSVDVDKIDFDFDKKVLAVNETKN